MEWVRVVGVVLVVAFSIFMAMGPSNNIGQPSGSGCNFPAVFNFGDSNSDTGGRSAALRRVPPPYGTTFFGKPSGRFSDGQVVIDFIAEMLGLPYLNAYLDSIGTNFQHGANFATGGSTIQPIDGRAFEAGFSPISLDLQLLQFEQFKERTNELYNQGKSSSIKKTVPRPDTFSKALYTLDIGQNDLYVGFRWLTDQIEVMELIANITDGFALAIEKLYQLGGRNFWVHNTAPFGCLPYIVMHNHPNPQNVDQNDCVKSQNDVAQEFNKQLREKVSNIRAQHSDAVIIYVDVYSAKYTLISEAKKHGFENPFGCCCGHFGDSSRHCGMKANVNGTEVNGAHCSDPSSYISWDGVHYSHAANQWIANHIIDGSFSDPPIPITEACDKIVQ